MPVAMETKEKGMPADVQVDEPEEIGAMSAEEAGDTVGCKIKSSSNKEKRQNFLCPLQHLQGSPWHIE